MKIKTMFIGSGEFAIPSLESMINNELIELVCVVTQPDKPIGRKRELAPTPVGEWVMSIANSDKDIKIEKPEKIRNVADDLLNKYQPDLIIVASYGQIIPEKILNYPKYSSLNIHGSILPELRGAVPVQMTIINGYKQAGVTIQKMVYEMDAGPILATSTIELDGSETTESLMNDLSHLGAELLKNTIQNLAQGTITETPQNELEATYCYKDDISKNKAQIHFDTDVYLAERMVRAFFPWPIAWLRYKEKSIKIYSAILSDHQEKSDEIKFIKKDKRLFLVLKNGCLEVLELQEEGKKRDSYRNYFYLAS